MADQASDERSEQPTKLTIENIVRSYKEDENFPYPLEFRVAPLIWTPAHYKTIMEVMTQGLIITRDRYLPIREEFDTLSAEEKEGRFEEFKHRVEPIYQTLVEFETNDMTKWMFQALNFNLAVSQPRELSGKAKEQFEAIIRQRAAVKAMVMAFQIVARLVGLPDSKLVKKDYLKEKNGFFDFEEYIESGSKVLYGYGYSQVQYRDWPYHSVYDGGRKYPDDL